MIAHNGKCANRLAAGIGAPAVYGQLRRLKLTANWVLLVAFGAPVPVPGGMEGAFVDGCSVIAWAGNNSAKLGLGGGAECWTLISTRDYGKANKVPQVRTTMHASAMHDWALCTVASSPAAGSIPAGIAALLPCCRRMCLPRWQSG